MENVMLGFLVFCSLNGVALAVDCYTCTSLLNSNCKRPDHTTQVDTCQSATASCYTHMSYYDSVFGISPIFTRGCEDTCQEQSGSLSFSTSFEKACCTGDLCNKHVKPEGYTSCYECSSMASGVCKAEGFEGVEETAICKGQCTKSVSKAGDFRSVDRGCSTSCTEGNLDVFGVSYTNHCCDGDFCNGSSRLVATWWTGSVAICLSVMTLVASV